MTKPLKHHPQQGQFPYITIEHVPTSQKANFTAYINSMNDEYTSDYQTETVLGRMDPIMSYRATSRKLSLEFDVVAASETEAIANFKEIKKLARFMYPKFSDKGAIKSAPLIRIHFRNLISDINTGKGLLGACDGFSYTPDFESTYISNGSIFPKKTTVSLTITVLHEKKPKDFVGKSEYPYKDYNKGSSGSSVSNAGTGGNPSQVAKQGTKNRQSVANKNGKKITGNR